MSSPSFYSRRRQFFREWRVLWKTHGIDTVLGGFYALAGFYVFRTVGRSQVYDVIMPLLVASAVAAHLAYMVLAPQAKGKTLPYYASLPRREGMTWSAHFAYLIGTVLWMEALILIGVYFQVGGANMTPHYRLHPELFVLPFLAVGLIASYLQVRRNLRTFFIYLLGIVLFCIGLGYWLLYGISEHGGAHNYYFPARGFRIGVQFLFAFFLFVATVWMLGGCRRHWLARQVGEMK